MKTKLIIAAAACVLGLASASSAATIANGSFESQSPSFTGTFLTLAAGSPDVTGWAIGGAGIDLINTYWTAEDGNYSLDMSALGSGTISQTITGLAIGAYYEISFWLAGNPDGSLTKSLTASTDEGSSTYSFVQTGNTKASMGWEQHSFTFQAAATTTNLTFASLSGDPYGPALDNISITTVPLPAGAPLLLAGVAGFAALRRRKSV